MADVDTDYQNFLELKSFRRSTGTGTVAIVLATSTQLAVSFVVSAAQGNAGDVYIGGPQVTSSVNGIILDAGETHEFPAIQFINSHGTSKYDLNRIYIKGSAASQIVNVSMIIRRRDQ